MVFLVISAAAVTAPFVILNAVDQMTAAQPGATKQ
jgi:hypothetical protein